MSDGKLPQDPSMEEIIASIGRIIAEDDGARSPAAAEEEVLELTEALAADGSVRHLEPKLAAPELSALEAGVEDEARRLLSEAPARAASTAFSRLKAPRGAAPPVPPTAAGAPTLEAIVRDALRPLLQRWLDEHLPALVERLVRDEIARLARDAGH